MTQDDRIALVNAIEKCIRTDSINRTPEEVEGFIKKIDDELYSLSENLKNDKKNYQEAKRKDIVDCCGVIADDVAIDKNLIIDLLYWLCADDRYDVY